MENSEDSFEIINEIDSESDLEKPLNKKSNNKTWTKLHSISTKLKIIKYAKENSQIKASIKYGIPKLTIHDWVKNESNYLNIPCENLQKTALHIGGKLILHEVQL